MKRTSCSTIAALTLLTLAALTSGCATLDKVFGTGTPEPKPAPEARAAKPAKYSFAEAQPLLVDAVRAYESRYELEFTRVVLDLDRWQMRRSDAGVLMGRRVPARAFAPDEAGVCWAYGCDLLQDEAGGQWGTAYLECNMHKYNNALVTCESVQELPELTAAQ